MPKSSPIMHDNVIGDGLMACETAHFELAAGFASCQKIKRSGIETYFSQAVKTRSL